MIMTTPSIVIITINMIINIIININIIIYFYYNNDDNYVNDGDVGYDDER